MDRLATAATLLSWACLTAGLAGALWHYTGLHPGWTASGSAGALLVMVPGARRLLVLYREGMVAALEAGDDAEDGQ